MKLGGWVWHCKTCKWFKFSPWPLMWFKQGWVILLHLTDPTATIEAIQWAVMPSMSHSVSESTISRWLHDAGLHTHILLGRLPLTPCNGVVPDCHGVTQNGSGSCSVMRPAFVLVDTTNKSVCGMDYRRMPLGSSTTQCQDVQCVVLAMLRDSTSVCLIKYYPYQSTCIIIYGSW